MSESGGNVFRFPPGDGGGTGSVGGGDGGGIHIGLLTPYIDAKMSQVRAELVNELDVKLRPLEDQLRGLPQTGTIWRAVGTLTLALFGAVGAIFGILAYTGDRVDGGVAAAGAYNGEIVAARQRDADQATTVEAINDKLDDLINQKAKPK